MQMRLNMNDRPDARNLLETARTVLLAEILPVLPAAYRYTALMIANAMAMVLTEKPKVPAVPRRSLLS